MLSSTSLLDLQSLMEDARYLLSQAEELTDALFVGTENTWTAMQAATTMLQAVQAHLVLPHDVQQAIAAAQADFDAMADRAEAQQR